MRWFLLGLLILVSCKPSEEECQKELESRCIPVLEDILRIQNIRDVVRQDFEITLSEYEAGRLSEEVWENERSFWLDRENELAGEVNQIYIYSLH